MQAPKRDFLSVKVLGRRWDPERDGMVHKCDDARETLIFPLLKCEPQVHVYSLR